jgi:thioredoxin 1
VLEELAGEWDGKVKVCKINVDEHKETAGSFEVQAIPTMILFKSGAVAKRLTGARPKAALAEELKDVL